MKSVIRGASFNERARVVHDNYYHAETYSSLPTEHIPFMFEYMDEGPISVGRFGSLEIGVRREWRDIRRSQCALYVIWFPVAGDLYVSHDGHIKTAVSPGQAVIVCGDRPFDVETRSATDKYTSQMHVGVPAHIMRSLLPRVDEMCGIAFTADYGGVKTGRHVFDAMLNHNYTASKSVTNTLSDAALSAILDGVSRTTPTRDEASRSLSSYNLNRVMAHINDNITDPALTAETAADACGISRRYLYYLFRSAGYTFKNYLDGRRIKLVLETAVDAEFDHVSLRDIIALCGFRTMEAFERQRVQLDTGQLQLLERRTH